jgi:hypothetical protein
MNPGIAEIDGWMALDELSWLYETARKVPAGELIVEIGVWHGRSSAAIYEGAGGENVVVSIDNWRGSPDELPVDGKIPDLLAIYKRNMVRVAVPVSPFEEVSSPGNYYLTADSLDAAENFADNSILWFFYDGLHRATAANLDAWLPKMKDGGIFSGHDYFYFHNEVQQEIHKRFYIHQVVGGIWVRYVGTDERPGWYR